MERRGRGGGEGAGRMRSRDWYWALVGLWVRRSHDEEKMRADFSCAGIYGAEIGSRCSYIKSYLPPIRARLAVYDA